MSEPLYVTEGFVEPTYTDRRLANLRKKMAECDDIALSLLENAPYSHDFRLLTDIIKGMLRQIDAFRKKHEGEQP